MNDLAAYLSDADRDRTVRRLQDAYADGRLSLGEMELRVGRALTARSPRDLLAQTADLADDVVELNILLDRFPTLRTDPDDPVLLVPTPTMAGVRRLTLIQP